MYIKVRIKSENDNTPYRVFINDELITERFYTAPKNQTTKDKILKTSNTLTFEITDADDYIVNLENIPGYPKQKIWIDKVEWQEESYAN